MGQDPLKNYLSWADLIMMTLGFSFPTAVLGFPPFVGIFFAAIIFGLSYIDENVANPKNKDQRYAAFLTSLIIGTLGSYIAAGALFYGGSRTFSGFGNFSLAAGGGIIAGLGLGVIMTAICLAFFVNYGTALGWWTPTGGLVTLLVSIIPAMAIGKNVGINILTSFIVSSSVYSILVRDNQNKKEPWMVGQSAYIGIIAGTAMALCLPSSNVLIPPKTKQMILDTGLGLDIFAKSGEGAINSLALVIWFVYFIIWILTHVPGALPHGWDTLFKYK
jgi:hypothetical protein